MSPKRELLWSLWVNATDVIDVGSAAHYQRHPRFGRIAAWHVRDFPTDWLPKTRG